MKLQIINKLIGAIIAMSLNCFFHSTPIEVNSEGICWIEGRKYTTVGFGTFPLKDETCFTAVEIASESGH